MQLYEMRFGHIPSSKLELSKRGNLRSAPAVKRVLEKLFSLAMISDSVVLG